MTGFVAVAAAAFVVMEPVTYLVHRFVMHGLGQVLHRSHHRRWRPAARGARPGSEVGFFEANDAFPVVFAAVTLTALAAGFNVDGLSVLVPVCVGVTAYGAAYAFVHDVYIHGRLPLRWRSDRLDRLAGAHALHHRFGGEPYGMLWPVVPAHVRDEADRRTAQRDARRSALASGRSGERVDPVPAP